MLRVVFPGYLPYDGDFDNPLREAGTLSFNSPAPSRNTEYAQSTSEKHDAVAQTSDIPTEHALSEGENAEGSLKPSVLLASDTQSQSRSKDIPANVVSFAAVPTISGKSEQSADEPAERNYPESNPSLKAFTSSVSGRSEKTGSYVGEDDISTTAVRNLNIDSGSSGDEDDPETPADPIFVKAEPLIQDDFHEETAAAMNEDSHNNNLDKSKELIGASIATSAIATAVSREEAQGNEHGSKNINSDLSDPSSTRPQNNNNVSQQHENKKVSTDKIEHHRGSGEKMANQDGATHDTSKTDDHTQTRSSEPVMVPASDQTPNKENEPLDNEHTHNKLHKEHSTNRKSRQHSVSFGEGLSGNDVDFPKDQNENGNENGNNNNNTNNTNTVPSSPTSARHRNKLRKKSISHRHHSSLFNFRSSADISPDEHTPQPNQPRQKFSLDETTRHSTGDMPPPKKKNFATRLFGKFREK